MTWQNRIYIATCSSKKTFQSCTFTCKTMRKSVQSQRDLELVTKDGTKLITNSVLLAKIGMKITSKTKTSFLLEEANRDVMEAFEAHINGKSLSLEPITVWKVVAFAKRYHLQGLLEECFVYFQDNISLNCCGDILKLLQKQSTQVSIKSKLYHFMRVHFCQLFKNDHFLEVYDGTMFKQLLDDDFLNVQSESAVWEAIDQWINRKDERLKMFRQLVSSIRFGRLPIEYLKNFTKSSSIIVSTNENLTLIKTMITEHQKLQNKNKDGFGLPASREIRSIRPRVPYSIVWLFGGWEGGTISNSIVTYDGHTNTWFESQMHGKLTRTYYALEQLNGQLYIIGGSDGDAILDTLIRYDPIEKKVTTLSPMSECRCYVASATLNMSIYAIGGRERVNRLDTCERYDVSTNKWTFVAAMNSVRSDASAVAFRGKIYVAGGVNVEDVEHSVEVYDPQCDRWTLIEYMASPRSCFALILYHGQMYALGGYTGTERIALCECYNFKHKCWSSVQPMLHRRGTFRATLFNDQILVVGGFDGESSIKFAEVYNDQSDKWKPISSLPVQRSGFALATLDGLFNASQYIFNGSENISNSI